MPRWNVKYLLPLVVIGLGIGLGAAVPYWTNGVPAATPPLTGNEQVPADTYLGGSTAPQQEAISTSQLGQFVRQGDLGNGKWTADTHTANFTATAAQTAGAKLVVLELDGTLASGSALTMPTAGALVAATPGAFVGETYQLRFINDSSGAFAWTITGNASVTISGTATVAQHTSRDYLVTLTSLTAVAMQNVGSGGN